ncbi:hypothetical protein HMPREF0388_0862 [Mobiluncus curtisii ATCC 51333]|uniref:Uncharacterized protein n=1 Tax=Mobiluncus curtisii ATCC 51333 TaxID=887326 RepID=E6LYC5_9ACTO|nr:hypothetical protein HMPREF0388_0862 [Mobiluncus curtisii ATCC 51333]
MRSGNEASRVLFLGFFERVVLCLGIIRGSLGIVLLGWCLTGFETILGFRDGRLSAISD